MPDVTASKPEVTATKPEVAEAQPSAAARAMASHLVSSLGPTESWSEHEHEVVLPSHGIPYVDANGDQLLPDGKVRVRSMTGAEEAVLNSAQFNEHTKAAKVIEACTKLVTPDGKRFDVRDLITTDRLILMLFIRAFSLGAKYRAPAVCSCGNSFTTDLDLVKDMDVQEMPRKITNSKGEVVEYRYDPIEGIRHKLPASKVDVVLRLLTGRDEEFMYRESAKDKSTFLPPGLTGDKTYFLRIMLAVREFGGRKFDRSSTEDMKAMCAIIKALPIRDTQSLNAVYMKHDVGIPLAFPTTCPACGEEAEVYLRLTNDFFRASDDEGD